MKKLVIIGCGQEQEYAYKKARELGHFIIGTDKDENSYCSNLCDDFIQCSSRDEEKTLTALIKYHDEQGAFDGVMTIANDVPLTVSKVATYFGLRSHSVESSNLVIDKFIMKEAFSKNSVSCPRYWMLSDFEEFKKIVTSSPNKRFVIKPLDGRGARGVLQVKSTSNLSEIWKESLSWTSLESLLLEEFIEGYQISSESFLISGKAYTPCLSERNYSYLDKYSPYIIEDGGTIPAQVSDKTFESINKLIEEGSSALGVQDGIVKGDIVMDESDNPFIIELALRLSGGWFASDQIISATGVDLVESVIRYSLGEDILPDDLEPKWNRSTAIRYWFPEEGLISKIEGTENLNNIEGLIKHDFFRQVGDNQPPIRMHPDRFGYVIVKGENRDQSLRRVRQAIDSVQITIS